MSKYYCLWTDVGRAKRANALALNKTILPVSIAVGDGGGVEVQPSASARSLVREVARVSIIDYIQDPNLPDQVIFEGVLLEDQGNFWCREIGLVDADGDLIAVGNLPESYKPLLTEGAAQQLSLQMLLIEANAQIIEIKIDPTRQLATRNYVDNVVVAHEQKANPHPQYALKAVTLVGYGITNAVGSYATLPAVKAESVIYVHSSGLMYWTGSIYRSVDCGSVFLHPAATPRAGTIKANGSILSKTTYAGLWSWATENGLVLPAASWATGVAFYADLGDDSFRIPDLRGEFFRAWDDGRGADPGRVFGRWQADDFKTHNHQIIENTQQITATAGSAGFIIYNTGTYNYNTSSAGGVETRPRNVALTACIKY